MGTNGHKVRIGKLSEFRPQTANANKHTERGLRMLDDAMSEDGYVAPMTAVADAEIIDGSARLERAFDKFNDEAIILEHDGKRPIITVRTDIPNANTKEAKRIAVRANRVPQVDLEWNPDVLSDLVDMKVLEGSFSDYELASLLNTPFTPDDPNEHWKGMPECENQDLSAWKSIRVNFNSAESMEAFAKIVRQPLTENTRSIWYPAAEIGRTADKRYISES